MVSSIRNVGLLAVVFLSLFLSGCQSPEERAKGYFERGKEFVAKGDDLNARVQFLTSAKFNSNNVEVWRALAGVEERLKSIPALFGDLRRVVELDPSDIDSRLKLAGIMISAGVNEGALKVIEAAEEGDKPNAKLHVLKAIILLRTKDQAGSIREAERALQIEPGNIDATLLLASDRSSAGDADGALKLLDGLSVTTSQDKLRVSLLKVQTLARGKDLSQAISLTKSLIAENPSIAKPLRAELIRLYIAAKQLDDAESELRAAVTNEPADTKAGLNLVRFLISRKGYEAGKAELSSRIKEGGNVFDYQIAMADIDIAQNHADEAAELLSKLVAAPASPEDKRTAEVRLAGIYVGQLKYDSAEPLITDVLKSDNRNISALRLRAIVHLKRNEYDAAIGDLRTALNDQPKSKELLLLLAEAYERSEKYELAGRQYADALKASNSPDVASQYSAFLRRRGDLAQAESVLSDASTRYPDNLQLLTSLAEAKLNRKDWAGALAIADSISQLGNNASVADQIKAAALAGENRGEESVSALEAAHAAAPNAIQPVVSLVTSYIKLNKVDKADALLQEMLKKFPDNPLLLVLMGQTKVSQNKVDEAIQYLQTAIAKQPNDTRAYQALSNLYTNRQNYDAALGIIEQGIKNLPTNRDLRLTKAGLEIQKGDTDAAIIEYQTILKDQPGTPIAINNLVSLLLDNRTDKKSLEEATTLSDRLKDFSLPQFQDTYGWSAYKRGDYSKAVYVLEGLQNKLGNSAGFRYHLGMSYAAAEQGEKAKQQFRAALSLSPDDDLKGKIQAALKGLQ